MTISKRLTRAGLAFTVFGLCASMLPNSATAITGADACGSSSHSSSDSGTKAGYAVGGLLIGGAAAYFVLANNPQIFHKEGASGSSSLPAGTEPKPATQPVSETTQRQQLQQLKGFAYNGQ